MRRLVEFAVQDGHSVLVQVDQDGVNAGVTRGLGSRVVEQAQQSFEQAVGSVQPAVHLLLARLGQMTDRPDEIRVEFGLQLSAEAGAFIAAASSSANFQVSMLWRSASVEDRSDGPGTAAHD